jgi:hypothetical protein
MQVIAFYYGCNDLHKTKVNFFVAIQFIPITCHEDPEGKWMYSSTLSLTSALDVMGGHCHAPAVVVLFPQYRRLGGPQGCLDGVQKISPHQGSIPGPSSP